MLPLSCVHTHPDLHLLVARNLLRFVPAHAAEESLPELNYEGEPLKLSRFLQNGVRRPVLVRESCPDASHPQPVVRLLAQSLSVRMQRPMSTLETLII